MYCEDADLCLRMVLLGYRGLYVPEARAYHAWAATTGRGSTGARYYSVRNTLTTLLKDMPASVLLASLPKIVLYQSHHLAVARDVGDPAERDPGMGVFLRSVPSTLSKRRRVMRRRAISSREFEALLISGLSGAHGTDLARDQGLVSATGSPVRCGGSAATCWSTCRSRSALASATATGSRDRRRTSWRRRSRSSSSSGRTGRGASSIRSAGPARGGSS